MIKFITISYKIIHRERQRLFYFLIAVILITASFYAFLIQKAIMNVVAREKVMNEVMEVSTRVALLEEAHLSLKNNITLELAYEKGLKDTGVSYYISKKSLTAMASKNEL